MLRRSVVLLGLCAVVMFALTTPSWAQKHCLDCGGGGQQCHLCQYHPDTFTYSCVTAYLDGGTSCTVPDPYSECNVSGTCYTARLMPPFTEPVVIAVNSLSAQCAGPLLELLQSREGQPLIK